jgi:hypothetical protein
MSRKGYVLTATLLVFAAILSIMFSALPDIAKPRIDKAAENTGKLSAGLLEIRDALNTLWLKDSFPVVPSMTLDDLSKLTGRDFSLKYFNGLKSAKIDFYPAGDGVNAVVQCVLYDPVEIYPDKILISGVSVKEKEIDMTVRFRRGNVL